jgi:hypothetical protein
MQRLKALDVQMLATPDQEISLIDPDARSMATIGRGSRVVGYNVQVAVDTKHHLIVTHEVTNVGNDRSLLAGVAKQTKNTLETESLDVVADRGYFNSAEILTCEEAGITVTLPKPMTSNAKADGRFGKQDFRYVADEDVYICPAGERLAYRYTNEENGLVLRRYWTNACRSCAIKYSCTPSKERRITRWEHEHVLDAVQRMKRFVERADRGQSTLFPECLDDWIDEDNPVRVIDVFVDALDLGALDFGGVDAKATGRPSYHPSILLKLYVYGYLNRVQSSRNSPLN